MPTSFAPSVARLLAWTTLVLGIACSSESPESSASASPAAAGRSTAPSPTVRLSDLLETASIESPLNDVAAARSLAELEGVKREVLFAEDFESFDLEAAGWPDSIPAEMVDEDGNRSLQVERVGRQARGMWVQPARPTEHYLFHRRVKPAGPLLLDFAVVEASDPGAVLVDEAGPFAIGEPDALRLHWPTAPEALPLWQGGAVSFRSTQHTRALGLVLRPTAGGQGDFLRWGARELGDRAARFDDVVLERLSPTPEQIVALLKAQSLAAGADPALGIEKHGQFLPIGKLGRRHRPEDDNFSFRYGLYAPPPTDLRFPVELAPSSSLGFSVCLAKETDVGGSAACEIVVLENGEETVVWSEALVARGAAWTWREGKVDLASWAGRPVTLILRTRTLAGAPHPIWGNPMITVPPPQDLPRNVILIAVDTLRADRLSCYGYERKTSPNLDALASDGVRFEHVASNSNWTCPSFSSIFTGMVPAVHGVWASGPIMPLPEGFDTLAERFRDAGWATNSIAYKAVLYSGGYDQGFDVSFNVPRTIVRARDNLTEALEWLEQSEDRRNFLFLHFDDPHQPFTQPPPFDAMFGADLKKFNMRLPAYFDRDFIPEGPVRDLARSLYDGSIAYVDDRIGAFVGELKERGLYDDAAIVLVSDHGEALWEHGLFGHGGLRLHDEVVRVPLIVKPSRIGAGASLARGKVVQTQVRAFDIMPTLLDFAGIEHEGLDAETLQPLLVDAEDDAPDRVAVIETNKHAIALRTREWKYILRFGPRGPNFEREMLYHHAEDPGEQSNLIDEEAEVLERMRVALCDATMTQRSGHYVVAIAEEVGATRVGGAGSAITWLGPQPEASEGAVRFAWDGSTRLALFAELESGEALSVDGERVEPERYLPGTLARLLREQESGVLVFAGPPVATAAQGANQSLDLRQLEAIKELGYVGEGGVPEDK